VLHQSVEAPAPSFSARDDLGCECAVPFVRKLPTAESKRGWKIGASIGDGAERVKRGNPAGGRHAIDEFTNLRIDEFANPTMQFVNS
jgi:hypothetical protein